MADRALVTSWAVCGIAAAAARFVPVPLLDDVVRQRATRLAVGRTLRAHGRDVDLDALEPLWGERGAGGSRLRRHLRKVSRRLLLFPVRKYAALFGAVRGVPTDLLRVVLLARTVDRLLDRGAFSLPAGAGDEARTVRDAVDAAMLNVDLRLLTASLSDGLSSTRGLTAAAVRMVRGTAADDDAAVLQPDQPVAEGAAAVTDVLERPEVQTLLLRFDADVDARLAA